MTDTIADMLTRIRNAYLAKKTDLSFPYSSFKAALAKLIVSAGFASSSKVTNSGKFKNISLQLKYFGKLPSVTGITRISKPGRRHYITKNDLYSWKKKPGVTIISTSQGLLTHHQAIKKSLGGEIICRVW